MVSPEMTKETGGIGITPVGSTGHDDKSVDGGRTDRTEEPLHNDSDDTDSPQSEDIGRAIDELENQEKSWFAYLKTKDFYIVLILGYAKYSMCPSAPRNYDILSDNLGRSLHYASRLQTHSLRSL